MVLVALVVAVWLTAIVLLVIFALSWRSAPMTPIPLG